MRKKAEKRIRDAAAEIGSMHSHMIDKIRRGAGLFRKVFDKTILDMHRVGTIELTGKNISEMNGENLGEFIIQGDIVYISFVFTDEGKEAENPPPELPGINILLEGVNPAEWDMFRQNCEIRESKDPIQKVLEMICEYNRRK